MFIYSFKKLLELDKFIRKINYNVIKVFMVIKYNPLALLFLAIGGLSICHDKSNINMQFTIVSDVTDWIIGTYLPNGGDAVLSIIPSAFTAKIPGANWI